MVGDRTADNNDKEALMRPYFMRKWWKPLTSKRRSELRMNRREKLKRTFMYSETFLFLAVYGASRQWDEAKRNRTGHGVEKLWERLRSLSVGFYFWCKWRQPLMSKKQSELRMNRRCGRWKYIYGFLRSSFFSVLYGASCQREVAKRIRAEHGE